MSASTNENPSCFSNAFACVGYTITSLTCLSFPAGLLILNAATDCKCEELKTAGIALTAIGSCACCFTAYLGFKMETDFKNRVSAHPPSQELGALAAPLFDGQQ